MDRKLNRIVVVGGSLAGLRAAETLRAEGYDGALTIVGDERRAPYDRPPLSKELLAGTKNAADVALGGADELDAEWITGAPATGLDLEHRTVLTTQREVAFDGLVIATGSAPRRLADLDVGLPNVHELRTLDDALRLREGLAGSPRVLLVGAGFIGVEVAATARSLGADVTIVSLTPPVAVAGELVSTACATLLDAHGIKTLIGRTIAETIVGDRLEAVVLDDGTRIEVDHVVVAVGAKPGTDWLEGSGLTLDNGVVCDAGNAAVGVGRIVAAGDVARWPNPLFGDRMMRIEHWTNATEGAAAAAKTLLHGRAPERAYRTVPGFWSDHFGLRLQSVGLPQLADRFEVVDGSVADGRFAAAAYSEGRLVGCIAYSMPRALVQHRMLLTQGAFLEERTTA